MVLLFHKMKSANIITKIPVDDYVAAVSVGIVDGHILLDLDYDEDSRAEVDMNVVMDIAWTIHRNSGNSGGKNRLTAITLITCWKRQSQGIIELTEKQRDILGCWGRMVNRIVLGTKNRGKIKEIKAILGDLPVEILPLDRYSHLPRN